ncbi:MAG: NAD(P)-dependent oxidoreductase [Pseudomonadales bacterium]
MQNIRGKTILVTGGHGFIGAPLARRLAALGGNVHVVSRTSHVDTANICSHALDLADFDSVQHLFESVRPDIVLHLASHVVGVRTPEAVLPTFQNNLMSTVHLLLSAQRIGCSRVVLTGSLEEPDDTGGPVIPSSPYAAAKYAASAYGRMFQALFGLSVIVLRVFMVYGPGQQDLRKLVPYVITSLDKGMVPSFTSGERSVDWIFVDDVVDAFVRASVVEGIDGMTLDIGSGRFNKVRDIVELLFKLMRHPEKPQFGGCRNGF